ncbi:hypothetical protein CANMA_003634 [Candida margitis]|uniref:uncharacterized protein n=1 Tax=Candida margitis TaxID=1775924 RepID=UPI0022266B63|nr:uncharacterized protein CANMA_003634 [Candida margitis]KAI5962859.1 hypothetical protein CANMA_003634 [Candida margitis]
MFSNSNATPTSYLYERASKTSDDSETSSDYCKKHPNSSECEKPVSNDSLTIALSIVLPVIAILCVLGYFLYRNYRKDRKEDLERDPDFYETGEATALPDYPEMKHEDPFHNRNSIRYPMEQINRESNYGGDNGKRFTQHMARKSQDPYLDSFVLPFQHQTGSKLSLDDYARNLGDSQGYRTPTPQTRGNSVHIDTALKMNSNTHSRKPSSQISPSKKVDGKQYTNIPNESNPVLQEASHEVSSIMDESGGSASDDSGVVSPQDDKFGITYENESEVPVNNAIPQIVIHDDNHNNTNHDDDDTEPHDSTTDTSPFNDKNQPHETQDTTLDTIPMQTLKKDMHDDVPDGDRESASSVESNTNPIHKKSTKINKSPRISAFNLLKNDSDAEDEEGEEEEELDRLTPQQQEEIKRMKSVYKVYFDKEGEPMKRNPDQEGEEEEAEEAEDIEPIQGDKINDDLMVDADYAKRYSNTSSVYMDPDEAYHHEQQQQQMYYNHFNQQYQQEYGAPVDPQLYQQFQQQQYYYYQRQQQQLRQQQRPPRPLPPLQQLRNPSDLRKSTLQTFTDFRPRAKNQTVMSPPEGKQPFVPIENDNVWTSPINSPSIQSQASFPQPQHNQSDYFHQQQQPQQHPQQHHHQQQQPQQHPQQHHHQHQQHPIYQNNKPNGGMPVPSATQASRSSVVMLNPVTEITKSRKFRPAGSLPSNNQLHAQFGHSDLNGPENDLLPSNRKSDVRRMMNSNF